MNDIEYMTGTVNRTWRDEHRSLTPEEAALVHATLGLVGEAGEVADTLKKVLFLGRDDMPVTDFAKELGDVQYYLGKLADLMKFTLGEIKALNAKKLAARYPQGFVEGGGIRTGEGA